MDQKIEIINNWNLSKFFNELENGSIKIPRFQRDYIWEKSKIVKLLNSIYHQYPIGSFFLWYAPKEYKNYIRESDGLGLPIDSDTNYYLFILDGQQRITSLYVTLRGKMLHDVDYKNICFNLNKKEFVLKRTSRQKNVVPVWKLIDPIAYGEVLADYAIKDREKKTNLASVWRECHEIFTNYPLSIVKTINNSLDDVVEIFERINQGGKRLTAYDLVQATTWSPTFDLTNSIAEFNDKINTDKLGALSHKVFTMSLTINVYQNFNNIIQLQLDSDTCKKHWPKTARAIKYSMTFIKDMGIKEDLTPYHPLIPILQYYFFVSGEKQVKSEHKKEMEKWFWDAKFSDRYSGSSTVNLKSDIAWIDTMFS